jgi:hypothetical protein
LHAAGAARPLDALIAGAQKSGTSTLAAALERLPGVVTHHDYMEFPFFIDETRFPGGYGEAFQRYFGNDLPEGLVLAKSAGVMFLESAVHQVAEHNPNLKVIVILREPVARAYSAYNFLRRQGREDAGTFEEGLAREADRLAEGRHLFAYRGRGDYLPQVRRLHEVLGADQVRVCLLEDLQEHEEELTRSLADWLGLEAPPELAPVQRVNESAGSRSRLLSALLHDPDSPLARMRRAVPGRVRRRIVTGLESLNQRPPDRVPMQQATRDELHEWFAPRNDALAGYIERDLTHWNRPSE